MAGGFLKPAGKKRAFTGGLHCTPLPYQPLADESPSSLFSSTKIDRKTLMKTPCLTIILLSSTAAWAQMSGSGNQASFALPPVVSTRAIERGANHEVIESVRVNAAGTALVTNHYTRIGNGLNYRDASGKWIPAEPAVQMFPEGVVCAAASYQVILATNLNTAGAVDLLTSDHKEIVLRPLGIAFHDPASGKRILLAQVKDCPPEMVSSNQIVYADAFDGNGIQAAVVYHYDVGRFSQDVKFLAPLAVNPADFGLGNRTRLEILTELEQSPAFTVTNHVLEREANPMLRAAMAEPDLVDQTLDFGEMRMPLGHAFPQVQPTAQRLPPRGVPVAKQLMTFGGRTVLVEAIPWGKVTNQLMNLPQQSARANQPGQPTALKLELAESQTAPSATPFASRLAQITRSRPGLLASAALNPQSSTFNANGFVMDYTIVESDYDVTFYSGETYLVEGQVYLYGTTTFNHGAIIKYQLAFDSLNIEGSPYAIYFSDPVILTSINDDTVGDQIDEEDGNNHHPEWGPTAGWEIILEYLDSDIMMGPLDFRYAYGGIYVDASAGHTLTLVHASFTDIYEGIYAGQINAVTVSSVNICNPDYPSSGLDLYEQSTAGTVSIGSISTCVNDSDNDGLPDAWEYKYFRNLNQTAAGDYDGDGLWNIEEWIFGTNPTVNGLPGGPAGLINVYTPLQ